MDTSPIVAELRNIETCHVGTNDNGLTFTEEELIASAKTMADVPIIINLTNSSLGDHADDSSMNTVGWTTDAWYDKDKKAVIANGEITDPKVVEKYRQVDSKGKPALRFVSMGCECIPICSICGNVMNDDVCSNEHYRDEEYDGQKCSAIAKDVKFVHLAITNFPADIEADPSAIVIKEYATKVSNLKKVRKKAQEELPTERKKEDIEKPVSVLKEQPMDKTVDEKTVNPAPPKPEDETAQVEEMDEENDEIVNKEKAIENTEEDKMSIVLDELKEIKETQRAQQEVIDEMKKEKDLPVEEEAEDMVEVDVTEDVKDSDSLLTDETSTEDTQDEMTEEEEKKEDKKKEDEKKENKTEVSSHRNKMIASVIKYKKENAVLKKQVAMFKAKFKIMEKREVATMKKELARLGYPEKAASMTTRMELSAALEIARSGKNTRASKIYGETASSRSDIPTHVNAELQNDKLSLSEAMRTASKANKINALQNAFNRK